MGALEIMEHQEIIIEFLAKRETTEVEETSEEDVTMQNVQKRLRRKKRITFAS